MWQCSSPKRWEQDSEKCVVALLLASFCVTVRGVIASRGNWSQRRGFSSGPCLGAAGEGQEFSAYPKGDQGVLMQSQVIADGSINCTGNISPQDVFPIDCKGRNGH